MKLTIFTMAYNEQIMLPYFFRHYNERFSDIQYVFYDNQSTDNTKQIAIDNGCNVIEWDTNGVIDDEKMKELKNNCWKGIEGWVLVADPDELLDINERQLLDEQEKGTTIVKSCGFNMVNMENNTDFDNIKYGIREEMYDKTYLFNSGPVLEINFNHGAHKSSPLGQIKYSDTAYPLYHFKYISPDFIIERTKYTYDRLSDINKKMGWGVQWFQTEEQIKTNFETQRNNAVKVR